MITQGFFETVVPESVAFSRGMNLVGSKKSLPIFEKWIVFGLIVEIDVDESLRSGLLKHKTADVSCTPSEEKRNREAEIRNGSDIRRSEYEDTR